MQELRKRHKQNPLELVTLNDISEELTRRFRNYLLLFSMDGKIGKQVFNGMRYSGSDSELMGLVSHANMRLIQVLQQTENELYDDDEDFSPIDS